MATASSSKLPPPTSSQTTVSPLLLTEALSFSPQLLLDDIINIANNAVQDGVNGMESFLQTWVDQRARSSSNQITAEQEQEVEVEVEQGLVAFQTLLEYHTDIAFDFFEAWSMRNIFMVPPGLDIVLPSQEGLDLTGQNGIVEKEQELMDEIEGLRSQLHAQRKLKRTLNLALLVANAEHRRASTRLARLSPITPNTLATLSRIPASLQQLHSTVDNLPPLDPATIAALTQLQHTEPGKRQWETNKTGYLHWAVGHLLARARRTSELGAMNTGIDTLTESASEVGKVDDMRGLIRHDQPQG